MVLQVFADESYLLEGNRNVIAIAGWLSAPDSFSKFCTAWKSVLDSYGVKHFHFKEFVDKNHIYYKQTQYDGWDKLKRESFLFELAFVACELGVPVGACAAPDKTKTIELDSFSLKKHAYFLFCKSVIISTTRFKLFNSQADTIDFVFDKNDDPSWHKALNETFNKCKEQRAPFGNWLPKDDTECYPLQAADLYVYAMRQNAERFFNGGMKPSHARMLDFILEKNRPDVDNWTFTSNQWAKLVRLVVNHYREWKVANSNKQYFPLVDCPFLKPPAEREPGA